MTAAIHETQSSEYTTPKSFCFSYLELSPSYLKVVLKLSLNCLRVLSQGCLQVVSKWSSSCLKSVPKLPKSCLKVVAQRCVQVVLKLCLSCSKWCASDDSHDRDDHHDHPDDQHGEILGAGGLWPANREIPPFPPQEPGSNHHHHKRYHHNHVRIHGVFFISWQSFQCYLHKVFSVCFDFDQCYQSFLVVFFWCWAFFILREEWRYQIGWIFGKNLNSPWPPLIFGK